MGKQNNNFEYYKPQSDRDGLFIPSGSDSEDCKDSDSKTMFALPKRKIVRKKGLRRNKSHLCKEICDTIVPFIIASFIIGTLVSVGYIILSVNGMQREIELLKIQLLKVRSDEQSDLLHSKNIQTSVSQKLATLSKDEKEIKELKAKLKVLSSQVKLLNSTVSQMKSQKDSSSVSPNINRDLALLKKGMADTGGEIKKLSDESEGAKKTITLLSKIVKSLKNSMSELKDAVSNLDTDVMPTEPVDTLEPLSPTTSPVDNAKDNSQSLKKLSKLLKKFVDGYSEFFNNKTKQLSSEISSLKTNFKALNKTTKINFITLQKSIIVLQNVTKSQEVGLNTITTKLGGKPSGIVNTTSDAKVLGIMKGVLARLKDHQQIIANLTRRVSTIENRASVKDPEKREETVKISVSTERRKATGVEHRTKPSKRTESPEKTIPSISTTSGPMKTLTTDQPRKMKSSIKSKRTRSLAATTTEFPKTRALEGTESEASTTSVPSKSAASTISGTRPKQTKWETTRGPPMTSVRTPSKRMNVSTDSRHIIPSNNQSLDRSIRPTNVSDMGHAINVTNQIDSTEKVVPATGHPRVTTGENARVKAKSSEKPRTLDGDEPESRMGDDRASEMDDDVGTSDDGLFPFDDRLEDSMNPRGFKSSRRSKHGSHNRDDDVDALDRLDDSV